MKKYPVLLSLLLFAALLSHAATRHVLFIGNSYTYTNNMPSMLQAMATANGDTLIYDASDPGGYTLQQHATYGPTLAKITSQQWDIVVLQEQSEMPSFPPSQVQTDVYPYARMLDSLIHDNDSCTQTMFMMTWGHANGDPANCAVYPVICTYDGMQQRLRESYMEMTQDNAAIVAPVGAAWKVVRDSFPALWLYQPDSTHPSLAGSYLQTCVLYASIFHKRTSGCTYTAGVAAADVQNMQRIADRVVMDSLAQWQQYGHYPNAAFSYAQSGAAFQFSDDPIAANTSDHWDFGDSNIADTADPAHTYSLNNIFTLTHTVSNACFSESQSTTINTELTGVAAVNNMNAVTVLSAGNNKVIFHSNGSCSLMKVYDLEGRCIRTYNTSGLTNIPDSFIPGIYILKTCFSNGASYGCQKFSVY